MTDDAIGIIASNLTIAHFSRYERKPYPTPPPQSTLNEIRTMEEAQQFAVTKAYERFLEEIKRRHSDPVSSDT